MYSLRFRHYSDHFCFVMVDLSPSAGLQNGLIGLGQDLVADLGVGNSPVFLTQVKTQLALVAEV